MAAGARESAMTSMCARGPPSGHLSAARAPDRTLGGRGGVRRPERTGSLIGSPPSLGQRGRLARVQPGPARRLRTDRLVARVDFTGGGADAVVGVSPPAPVGTAMAARARGRLAGVPELVGRFGLDR